MNGNDGLPGQIENLSPTNDAKTAIDSLMNLLMFWGRLGISALKCGHRDGRLGYHQLVMGAFGDVLGEMSSREITALRGQKNVFDRRL